MTEIKFTYHNVNLDIIQKKINNNKKKVDQIYEVITKLSSLNISDQITDLHEINNISNHLTKNYDTFVIFGTGGSNLGSRALINILQGSGDKKIFFFDNIDPIEFSNSILKLNIDKTSFIVISKSGSTAETLGQFSSIIEIFESQNKIVKLSQSCIIITENIDSPLRRIANKLSCKILNHAEDIGGRYSVFSNVGLLPACIAGLNISKIREGASHLIQEVHNNSFNEYLIGATISTYLQSSQSININVLLTYTNALYYFGKWYLQLWAESIGKNVKGITPIHSIGTTDQHSQLQLYLDGPKDKFFTLIAKDHQGLGLKMNKKILEENNASFLAGKKMGDLMHAEQKATLNTLIEKKLPVREIYCNEINEFFLGQLMAYFMIETIAACYII